MSAPLICVAPDNASVLGTVILEDNISVWFNAVLRGDNGPFCIAQNSNIQDGTVLHTGPDEPLTVAENVTVGTHAMLYGCTMCAGNLIGIKAVVLNHVGVGINSLIGANALIIEGRLIPDINKTIETIIPRG